MSTYAWTDLTARGWGLAVALAVAALATAVLVSGSRRLGLVDAPDGPDAARKLQRGPLALAGGTAVLLGLAAGGALSDFERLAAIDAQDGDREGAISLGLLALACLLAYLAGLTDDRAPHGLGARAKLALQAVAALPCAAWGYAELAVWHGGGTGKAVAVGLVFAAVAMLAMNATNTFDHADGVLASVAIPGLALTCPLGAAALLGFLPFNFRREPRKAILGDSGSHLVGMLIAFSFAWPALTLPLLDLARVSWLRVRAGQAPWVGDRRHFAHGLQARGWSPGRVALTQFLVALPSTAALPLAAAAEVELGACALMGGALTALLFGVALAWWPDPRPAELRAA